MGKEARVDDLVEKWEMYRINFPEPKRYEQLAMDLYCVRNKRLDPMTGAAYPATLIDGDDEIMAAVEHYFLCRDWVGNGKFPLWEAVLLVEMYDKSKKIVVKIPFLEKRMRHNPANPMSPPSEMQVSYQYRGLVDGIKDTKQFSVPTSYWPSKPPAYWN